MKSILFSLLFVLGVCSVYAQEINCSRQASFGSTLICLPVIEGYQESYLDPIVGSVADRTEIASNMVIGFYLNDDTFSRRDSLGSFSFDDYFKVYGTHQLKELQVTKGELPDIKVAVGESFTNKTWDQAMEEFDSKGLGIEIGVPVSVESYSLDDRTFTYVMLVKYDVAGGEPYVLAMTINGLLINERLVWMAYYLNYHGDETLPMLKSKSNLIIDKMLKASE